ncbi:hypothetical protein NQ317_002275 [Molorchus minor]|uniref:Uncharacterized protein n=1 Tax=Molorchus minor TaxID=1323400 RepID=A0ABQ9J5S6_9CUCU|nr:hypothetical protein NQ317_002275 [Molorchus minor]
MRVIERVIDQDEDSGFVLTVEDEDSGFYCTAMYIRQLVLILFSCLGCLATNVLNADTFKKVTPVKNDDIGAVLDGFGYPFEDHTVTTEDGYVLGVHRIPYGRNESTNSTFWGLFVVGPGRSIALALADEGYDVWLGNNRGNMWSRKHTTLDPDNQMEFWDFSFHEMGFFDTPAIIDYILNITGSEQISYIGHSEGTTQLFVMASMKPEYNSKNKRRGGHGPSCILGERFATSCTVH